MAVYAGMVDRIDQQVGRLMAKLRQWQVEDNTLVMFLSDNGARPFDPRRVGSIGTPGSRWSLGAAWANASNTPFRLYKRNQHNGGIATPFIAYWPNTIHSSGDIVDDTAHVIDIMPTLIEITGWRYSTRLAGHEAPPLPGRSLLPLFRGDALPPRGPLFFQVLNHRAILEGHWKLVSAYGGPWELYRMDIDRTESHDLSSAKPEQVRLMADQWEYWWQGRPNGLWRSRNQTEPPYIRLTPEALASESGSR
jgi:arylsulfatase